MKKIAVLLLALVAVLGITVSASEEKQYIVYPSISTFSARENPAGFIVVDEETYKMMEEEGLVSEARECVKGELFSDNTEDPYYQWDITRIGAYESVRKYGYKGEGIRVGVIDSGVDEEHPNLEMCIEPGYNYLPEAEDTSDTTDYLGHGTFVAGRICANVRYTTDGKNWGFDGVAPKVTIVPLKVTDDLVPDDGVVIQAIYGAVQKECDVINLSLGFSESTPELKEAVDYAVSHGVIVVAAVGNSGTDKLYYPAAYDNVIGVGATDKNDLVWHDAENGEGSQKNTSVFITAPGVDILSTYSYYSIEYPGEDFMISSGTSHAAPLVTGAVALMKEADPTLTLAEIMNILEESADDEGEVGYDTSYGHGILNVAKAIELTLDTTYLAPSGVSYIVRAADSKFDGAISVTDPEGDAYKVGNVGDAGLGKNVSLVASPTFTVDNVGYKFAYWRTAAGDYVSENATYPHTATTNFVIEAVYEQANPTTKRVEYFKDNGVFYESVEANEDGTPKLPEEDPTITGYLFDKWSQDGKTEFSASTVLSSMVTRVVGLFKRDETEDFKITVPQIEGKSGTYCHDDEITLFAENAKYWTRDGKVVEYGNTYIFNVWDDSEIKYYTEETEKTPSVYLDPDSKDGAYMIEYNAAGYTVVEAGILFGKSGAAKPRVDSYVSKASSTRHDNHSQFASAPSGEAQDESVVRGYLIYSDGKTTKVVYSD